LTRKQIADRISYTLGLQDDTTYPETQFVLDLILEGIVDISSRTRVNARVINLTVSPNTKTHDLSSTVIALLDIEDTDGVPLDRFTREDIGRAQRQGQKGYAWREKMLWLSPISSQPVELRAYGIFRPQAMPGDSDTPSHPDYGGLAGEFHPTIITYALWKGGEYMQHEASGNGEKWRVQYEGQDGLSGEISKIKRIANKRATVGGPRRRNPLRTVGSVPDAGYWI
jgi:hypothetical protein